MEKSPWQPGHFYSPTPNDEDIQRAISKKRLFQFQEYQNTKPQELILTLKELLSDQLNILPRLLVASGSLYPKESRQFTLADAIVLFCIIARNKPKKIVEIGSGHSSAFMIDVRNFLELEFEIICIEPFPLRLRETLGERIGEIELKEMPVQEIKNEFWENLEEDCLVFIDSSHVSKAGSDVNHLFFDVLPHLKTGTLVHFHDIFNGFEYPEKWLDEGRAWNESYLLRAFLMFNDVFNIYTWPQLTRHSDEINKISKIAGLDIPFPGSSIYLRKTQ